MIIIKLIQKVMSFFFPDPDANFLADRDFLRYKKEEGSWKNFEG